MCDVLSDVRPHQLPVHQGAGGAGLHCGHRPVRHQRLVCLPVVLGGAASAVCRPQDRGADPLHHRHLAAGLHGVPSQGPRLRGARRLLCCRDCCLQGHVQEVHGGGQLS